MKKPSKRDPKSIKNALKMRAPKKHEFWESPGGVPGGILFPPDLPKMITNQKINYR